MMLTGASVKADPPNILIMMSDDQSFPHASAYGSKMVLTPNFDRIARDGMLFNNAFCAAPGCSPSRAAFLTGRQIWMIENAGTHASSFAGKYLTFMDLLESAGYHTGYTGKGWAPGNFKAGGREQNPAGPSYGAKRGNYAAGFERFLKARPGKKPFAFWFGSSDPHRGYQKGSGRKSGKTLSQAEVPAFLPDTPEIRDDLLDYAFEIERFDRDCGRMLELLEATGEIKNTLIIVTSDNGMPFPYAKANCTEFGIHMPLAIAWGSNIKGRQTCDALVSFTDLSATIHEVTGIKAPAEFPLAGRSFLALLLGKTEAKPRTEIFSGRERHSSSRYNTLGYPQRCIRTDQFLYVRNFKPERWPAGPGQKLSGKPGSRPGPEHGGYHDIDACPSLSFLIAGRNNPKVKDFFHLAVAKRPHEQLFDIQKDPGCLNNLAENPAFTQIRENLSGQLTNYLKSTADPRATGNGDIFETYPRYSSIRWFAKPEWARENPGTVPEMPWLKAKQ
ncbi:MAG: sulfatase [Verrucomicrobiaceae bacterium]|nr:sulfatase [Verrucomicrobiaceae bacterium]